MSEFGYSEPTTIVARGSLLGSTRFERITQRQAQFEVATRWWKLWNWGYTPDPDPDGEADR
jgi:hypothetical protein